MILRLKGMLIALQTLEDYLLFLRDKGFRFEDDALGFIYLGKHSTDASDRLVKLAVEITIKSQKRFDGSFYVSFLELLKENKITNRKDAFRLAKKHGLNT